MINTGEPMNHTTRERLYETIIYHHPDADKRQLASVRTYFETGDIHKYLDDELYIDPIIAMYMAPQHDLQHFKQRFELVWEWLRQNEGHHADHRKKKQLSWDGQITHSFGLLFIEEGTFFPPAFFAQVFSLAYGNSFSEQHELPISIGVERWHPLITPNFIDHFVLFAQIFNSHTYGRAQTMKISANNFIPVIDYFVSMVPELPAKYYSLTLASDETREGEHERINQYNVRTLVAHINGIITDGLVYAGYKKVPIDDEKIHAKLLGAFTTDRIPEAYHRLVEFLRLQDNDECVYESA